MIMFSLLMMLSLMTITRERQSHSAKRQNHRRRDPRSGQRPHPGLRHRPGGYVGSSGIIILTGAVAPVFLSQIVDFCGKEFFEIVMVVGSILVNNFDDLKKQFDIIICC